MGWDPTVGSCTKAGQKGNSFQGAYSLQGTQMDADREGNTRTWDRSAQPSSSGEKLCLDIMERGPRARQSLASWDMIEGGCIPDVPFAPHSLQSMHTKGLLLYREPAQHLQPKCSRFPSESRQTPPALPCSLRVTTAPTRQLMQGSPLSRGVCSGMGWTRTSGTGREACPERLHALPLDPLWCQSCRLESSSKLPVNEGPCRDRVYSCQTPAQTQRSFLWEPGSR